MTFAMNETITLHALPGIPDVQPGDDLTQLIIAALDHAAYTLRDGDVLVVAQKIVSKAEGRYVHLPDITPSAKAIELATYTHKDPHKIQIILDESRRVVRATEPRAGSNEGLLITEHRCGFICANSAVDESNVNRANTVLLLPIDADASARSLQQALQKTLGIRLGIIISDTFGRPWRRGLINFAIGVAGIPAFINMIGTTDAYGRELHATVPAVADELAAASGLVMGKDSKTPVVILQGLRLREDHTSTAQDMLRPKAEDLFR